MAKRNPDLHVELPTGLKGEKVRRDIATLALTPVNMNLSLTARKVYTVLLYLAQRTTKNSDDGGYSAPLSTIVKGSGSHVKMAGVVLKYLQQMTSTNVIFRPVSDAEQYSLIPDAPAEEVDDSEVRVFALLAEARIFKRGGDNWITWFYPPTIEQQIIDPGRWAVIELDVIAMLTTYTAVALYEIVARYRDAPGQLTPKRAADFWVPILRGNATSKDREWRKFKAEFVMPAIEEINEVSDLQIEIIEHKYGGRKVIDVQFAVSKKQKIVRNTGAAVDVSVFTSGAELGVKDADVENLVKLYGEDLVKRAFLQLDLRVANKSLALVGKPAAYLQRLLANMVEVDEPSSDLSRLGVRQKAKPELSGAGNSLNPAELSKKLYEEFHSRRIQRIQTIFSNLTDLEQASWMDRLIDSWGRAPEYARSIRRLKERDWKSPIVIGQLMRFYATQELSLTWNDPSRDELAAIKADLKL